MSTAFGPQPVLSFHPLADPETSPLRAGQHLHLRIDVRDIPAVGLSAYQLELRFDPQQLEVRDPNAAFARSGLQPFAPLGDFPICALVRATPTCSEPGWLLTATGRRALGRVDLDAEAGSLVIAYATTGSEAPAHGAGTLAILELHALADGPTGLALEHAVLVDGASPPDRYDWALDLGPPTAGATP